MAASPLSVLFPSILLLFLFLLLWWSGFRCTYGIYLLLAYVCYCVCHARGYLGLKAEIDILIIWGCLAST